MATVTAIATLSMLCESWIFLCGLVTLDDSDKKGHDGVGFWVLYTFHEEKMIHSLSAVPVTEA